MNEVKREGSDGGGFRVLYAPKAPLVSWGIRCGDAEGWTRAENVQAAQLDNNKLKKEQRALF